MLIWKQGWPSTSVGVEVGRRRPRWLRDILRKTAGVVSAITEGGGGGELGLFTIETVTLNLG